MTGMDHITDLQIILLCHRSANNHLQCDGIIKHFALCQGLVLEEGGGGSHHIVAVIAVCHGIRNHRIDPGSILLQFFYNRIRDGSHRCIGEIHSVHCQLGLTAGRTNDDGVIARIFGNAVVHLTGHIIGQHTDTGRNDNGKYHQNDLHLFDGHILQRKMQHLTHPPFLQG